MASAEINAELVCPQLSSRNAQLRSQETRHNWSSEQCMISRQEAQAKFNEFVKHKDHMMNFTLMAPKINERVGATAVINRHFQDGETTCCQLSKRLPDNSIIFADEATTITLALNYYQHMGPVPVVFSDSMSCLQAIEGEDTENHLSCHIMNLLWLLSNKGTRPFLLDTKLVQTNWDVAVHGRDIYLVKPTLGPPKKFQHLTRAEEVVITRLLIGHTKATKSHILSRGPPTGFRHCGQTLTTDHMLLLQECRDEYYTVDSLNALFETITETFIVEFMWEAGFFYLIWCGLLTSARPQTCTI